MTRGFIVPIGGAEDKLQDASILNRFAEVCGGRDARIAVVPTASQEEATGRRYERVFEGLVRAVKVLPFEQRSDADHAEWIRVLEKAHGVFLTGGNQLRLATNLGGTHATDVLRRRNEEGLHVAGTSAGAAFLSEHMIAKGEEGATPRHDMVTLSPGMGLTNRVIIDQHFRQRDRLGRLLAALSYNPRTIGIGLDEDTAAFIGSDDTLEVVGSGGVTVVDASEVEYSSMDVTHGHEPVCLIGVRLHILVEGGTFDLEARVARPKGRQLERR